MSGLGVQERPTLCLWQVSNRAPMLHAAAQVLPGPRPEGEEGLSRDRTACGLTAAKSGVGYYDTEWQEPECKTCRRLLGLGPVRVPP